ncbi:hypothetical protein FEV13_01355 [Stutzerimonas degradans]|nr:hypothetical protein FEV13_01355 [Stutzerimonas degradans]
MDKLLEKRAKRRGIGAAGLRYKKRSVDMIDHYAGLFISRRLIVAAPGDGETRGIHDRGAVHDATHSF